MNTGFLNKIPIFRSKKSKTRFLERFFDFFTKSPKFSPNRPFLPKNRPNFFVFRDTRLIPAPCGWKCPRLTLKPIFGRNYRKYEYLDWFFVFLEPFKRAILTVNHWLRPITGAKNIDFCKIVQYVPKSVSRAIFRPNFRFSALKNSKSPFSWWKSQI